MADVLCCIFVIKYCLQLARPAILLSLLFYLRDISTPSPRYNLLHGYLDCLSLPWDIILVHYTDIMPIGPGEQEVAIIPDILDIYVSVANI